MLDPDQRRLLGDFVRAHRERLSPEAPAGRRRTPGMRREELAAKAGMSATWCAWIEQGREVQASPEALGRLARALVLSRAERTYLFELSGRRDPELAASDPMPGLVKSIAVREGQEVKAGEPLCMVEAMKMENVLLAERDATVKKIVAKEGDSLAVDAVIMEFA